MARLATARLTDGLSNWLRSALPDVVIVAPDEERARRDHLVDAAVYLGAFAISAYTLADTWQMHPPWLRVVAVRVCSHGPRATLAEPCGGGRQRLW